MMKKKTAVVLTAILIASLCACNRHVDKSEDANDGVRVHRLKGIYHPENMECIDLITTIDGDTMNLICKACKNRELNKVGVSFHGEMLANKRRYTRPTAHQMAVIIQAMLDSVHAKYNAPFRYIQMPTICLGETTAAISAKKRKKNEKIKLLIFEGIKNSQLFADLNAIVKRYDQVITGIGVEKVNYVPKDYFMEYNNMEDIHVEIPDMIIETYLGFRTDSLKNNPSGEVEYIL